ncbi:mannosyl-oligosaccharide alpha-1,2-mannosidase, variant 2 [Mucor circinelloides]
MDTGKVKPDYGPIADNNEPPAPPKIIPVQETLPEEDDFEAADDDFEQEIISMDQQPSNILFTQYPPPSSLRPNDALLASRQEKIIQAFQHAWKGYSKDAFGQDEYQPLTHTGHNWAPGGVGLMIVDALDTLMLMNLTQEYNEARSWIETNLEFNKDQDVNVFETTIRVLGGLLSAYHLSNNDPLYLRKAVDLGDRLLPAFNSESGIPFSGITLSNGVPVGYGPSSTAEATTIQLEFKYLSHLTGDMKYWDAAEKVMDRMNELVEAKDSSALDGLVPIYIDPHSGNFASREIRLGSRGDSYYEYLLKLYLQTDKSEIKYRERYDHAVDGIKKHLVQHSYPNNMLYIAELMDSSQPNAIHPKMDHLVCFMGGSFVLGVTEGASIHELDPLDKKDGEDFHLAQELTRTCYEMYNMTATGLASEIVYFNTNPHSGPDEPDMDIHMRDKHNLLRPETLESLFIMYRSTGEEKYRDWAWNIFESFEKYTKLPGGGYAALKDVTAIPPPADNRMDTFFLAETLKYLYLIFSPDDIIPLENYVLNTEAHPLPVFSPN